MTFLEKYELLKKSIPVPSVLIDSETSNCEYVTNTYKSKNSIYSIGGYYLEACIYTQYCGWGNKLVDCNSVTEAEKCYKCIDCNKCYSCTYLLECTNNTDCHFSSYLVSCANCFGCVGLTHKKYCIFNKQLSKKEYFAKVTQLKKEKSEKNLEKMFELKKLIPHPASMQASNENCPYGDYVFNSKNCYWSFNTFYNENSGYTFYSSQEKNCWDTFSSGGEKTSQRCYEIVGTENCYDSAFLDLCEGCTNCYYSSHLRNCTDCLGCVGLTNKKYCILNNQLSKDQYQKQ